MIVGGALGGPVGAVVQAAEDIDARNELPPPPDAPPDLNAVAEVLTDPEEDTDQPDLTGFGSAARESIPPPLPPSPTEQVSATVLGKDAAELRQQEAIATGQPVPIEELERTQQEQRAWLEENYPEAPESPTPDAVEAPLTPEEGQDTTQTPEGLVAVDPDTYERLADEPVREGWVGYQDPETLQTFQVPEGSTPEIIQARLQEVRAEESDAYRQAREEQLERELMQERFDQNVQTELAAKGLLSTSEPTVPSETPILQKDLLTSEGPEVLWNDVDRLKFQLDRQEMNLKRAQAGTLKDTDGAPVSPQDLENGVKALRDRYNELKGKIVVAKDAFKGMNRAKPAPEGGAVGGQGGRRMSWERINAGIYRRGKFEIERSPSGLWDLYEYRPERGRGEWYNDYETLKDAKEAAEAESQQADATQSDIGSSVPDGMQRGSSEQGSTQIPQAVYELGQAIYRKGMAFADWSRQMVRHLGSQIRPFLADLWSSVVSGVNSLSPAGRRFKRSGSVGRQSPKEVYDVFSEDLRASKTDTKPNEDFGEADKQAVRDAYAELQAETGFAGVSIADVMERAGFPLTNQNKGLLMQMYRDGEITSLNMGDWSLSDSRKRAWGVRNNGDIFLTVTMPQGMRRSAPTPEGGSLGSQGGRRQPQPPPLPVTDEQRTFSVMNAKTDEARMKMGLPPAMAPARIKFGAVWDEAMAIIAQNPDAGQELTTSLALRPRVITPVESAILTHESIRLDTAYERALDVVNQSATEGELEANRNKMNRIGEEAQILFDVTRSVGTLAGQNLAARKLLVNQDLTLSRMVKQTRAAQNGQPLSEKQQKDIEELHKKLKATEDELKRLQEKESKQEAANTFSAMMKELKADRKEAVKSGKTVTDFLNEQAEKARERLRSKMARTSAGVDPTILVDVAIIGASHIANGINTAAEFANRIVQEFGEEFRPYIPEIFKQSQEFHDANSKAFNVETKTPTQPTPQEILKEATTELDPRVVFELARAYVRSGMTKMEEVMDRIHQDLLPLIPGLEVRDVRDAFSGYGKVTYPSKAEDLVKLREMKVLARLTSQLEDVLRRQAPLRTGPQRDKLTADARILQKQINDLMRKYNIRSVDPLQQLKTSREAVKARLRNEIEELERAISTNTRRPANRNPLQYDAEMKALRDQRDKLKARYEELFPRQPLTPEQRIAAQLKALDKSIAEEEQMLREGTLKRPAKQQGPMTPEVENKKMELMALRQLRSDLLDALKPKRTQQEIALERDKKNIRKRITQLQEKLAKGDYSTAPKKEPAMDREKRQLQYDYQKLREEYLKGVNEAAMNAQGPIRKAFRRGAEVLNVSRAILTSADFSGVLRQGGFIAFGNPARASKALPVMFKSFFFDKVSSDAKEDIRKRANYPLYQASKLYLADDAPASLSQMEEAYMSRWINMLPRWTLVGPVARGSQRAYVTFLNRLRADSFDAMASSLAIGGKPTLEESRAIANFINVATGRGDLGKLAGAGVALNTAFFAPRYVLSRFQLLAGQPFYGGNARTRKLIAKEYAKYLIGVGTVVALLSAMGDDDDPPLETDPRSSDFLKVRYGNTRMDPLSGLLQVTTLIARVTSGEMKTGKGTIVPIRGEKIPFGTGDTSAVIGRFLRTKLSPALGTTVDLVTGKNVVGEVVTPKEAALHMMVPISVGEIKETIEEQGVATGTAMGLLSMFGIGLQTYKPRAEKAEKKAYEASKY